jgi:putative tryptophan/tyrosine transport system substrate-binding protein
MLGPIPILHSLTRAALFAWVGCAAMAALVFDVHAADIVVLKSSDVGYYTQAVQGFRQALPAQAHIVEYTLRDGGTDAREVGRSIRAGHPDLVLAVGLNAALAAKLEIPDLPVVFCLVLNPELHGLPAGNMTGVLMKIPHQQQLESIKSVAPHARRIGVLYDERQQAATISAAKHQAKLLGLQLIGRAVTKRGEVSGALLALLPQIDLLWVLPDQTVVTDESLPFLLESAFDAKIPLFGFSSTFVQRGALGAVVIDPLDAGIQSAQLAAAILRDPATGGMRIVQPNHPKLVLNLNTAEYLGLTLAPDLVRMASRLYGGPGAFASQDNYKPIVP